MKTQENNLDRIFEYVKTIKEELLYEYFRDIGEHFIPTKREIISLKINGDYSKEFKETITQLENKVTLFKKEQRNLISHDNGEVGYGFTYHEANKLLKEIDAIEHVFKGLEYTKINKIDRALVSYCNSIMQNQKSLFPYLGLASTIGYLSNLNKKLKNIGLSVNKLDLRQSLPLLGKLFCKQNLNNPLEDLQTKIDQSFLDDNYRKVLKSLMDLVLKRGNFEKSFLKIGKSANEVFIINEDLVDKLYVIKRTKKDNYHKKGNLRLEFQVLNYFNLIGNRVFGNELENRLEVPQPIEFMPNFDKNYNYLILARKKGQTPLSLSNQKEKEDNRLMMRQFIKQTARIHATGPIYLIKKRKYFTKQKDFKNQLKFYCDKASLNKTQMEELMRTITPVLRMIANSRDLGFVKDANLENAIYTKDKNIMSIDFEEIKYAPLQYDLARMLVFSFKQKDQFLDDYIQEYNNAFKKFRVFQTMSNPLCQDEKRRLIYDDEDFKFTFLNYTIFDAILTYLSKKYEKNSETKKIALDNAIKSVDELLTKYDHDWYKGSYSQKDWYKRMYSQNEKDLVLSLRNLIEDFRSSLSK